MLIWLLYEGTQLANIQLTMHGASKNWKSISPRDTYEIPRNRQMYTVFQGNKNMAEDGSANIHALRRITFQMQETLSKCSSCLFSFVDALAMISL